MKALIFDPYLDTLGGGERYMMTIAELLAKHKWLVEVAWPDVTIAELVWERLGIDLSKVGFVDNTSRGWGYDLVLWLSDGSIPLLFAKKNIVHFQTPFRNVGGGSFLNRIKIARLDHILCNSKFTKRFIDKEFRVKSEVIYPPVNVSAVSAGDKDNIILSVGRFSKLQQEKRQDILIKSFINLYKKGMTDWKLILAGGSDVGGREFLRYLRKLAQGYPIEIAENVSFEKIKKFYAQAKIFWSATGYGVDEETNPEKVEHFGISVVEAMAAGCIPIVYDAGGHRETIKNNKSGFLWKTSDALERITFRLAADEKRRTEMGRIAIRASKKFSIDEFEKKILKIVQ